MTAANGKVEIVFNVVNQRAEVHVNGNTIPQEFLAHGDGPVTKDITSYLKEGGDNEIFMLAYPGSTYSSIIASLKNNDDVIHTWHSHNAPEEGRNEAFFQENTKFTYHDGKIYIHRGNRYWLRVEQVDDKLSIEINGTIYYEKTLTHHGGESTDYELTDHMKKGDNTIKLRLYNGLGYAVLNATLYRDDVAYVANWNFSEAAGNKNAVVLEEEIHLIL